MTTRILIFSPYACRYHLTAYEGTIAKACQIRGAKVDYILCDGLLPECDMHWDSFPDNAPRPLHICDSCQTRAKRNLGFSEFGFPYRWLGHFVSERERRDAFNWAQGLLPSEIRQAIFMEYPLGEWVMSSVISYFRQYPPDINNWRVVNAYRGFVYSARIVGVGLTNYLKEYSVDSALLFNGRQSITRVAFEVFRRLGIRVLTHETPFYQRGHLMVKPNARCWSIEPFNDFWRMWGQVPLTKFSLEDTLKWLQNRRYGNGLSWYAYNTPHISKLSVRKTLGLNPRKRLLALFTSSTDETAGDPELQGPFESQSAWVQEVVEWVRERNDSELVIRVHPHLAGKTGLGKASDEFNFYLKMKSDLPENVRIILPNDSLNSYALMGEADICLSYGSSVGIEMALLGKPVVLASRCFYEKGSHILNIISRQSLPEILDKSLQPQSTKEIRREAFRLAFYYVFKFELPFPLVSMDGVMNANLNYTSQGALLPGKDSALDHICGYLIDSQPLFDPPSESEIKRTTHEEEEFLSKLDKMQDPLRDRNYEGWLRRETLFNHIGRSVQKAIKSPPFGIGNVFNRICKALYLICKNWLRRKTDRSYHSEKFKEL
jgi:hypothetical protein